MQEGEEEEAGEEQAGLLDKGENEGREREKTKRLASDI